MSLLQENFASLPQLLFSCKYTVSVQPAGTKGRAQAESTSFYTPSCATLRAKSSKHINCPGDTGEAARHTPEALLMNELINSSIKSFYFKRLKVTWPKAAREN